MCGIGGADDRHSRLKEILHGRAFAHEFGVDADTKVPAEALSAGTLERRDHDRLGRSGKHCAAHHDQVEGFLVSQNSAELTADGLKVSQVKFAIAKTWRADAKERDISLDYRSRGISGGAQAASFVALCDEFLEPWFHDWTVSGIQQLNLRRADVNAKHGMTLGRETRRRDSANVSQTEYADSHDDEVQLSQNTGATELP